MKILEFPEGREGGYILRVFFGKSRGDGGRCYTANPFCGGCMDMFWDNTIAGTSSQ